MINLFKEFQERVEKKEYDQNGYVAFLQQEKQDLMSYCAKNKDYSIDDGHMIHYFDENKIFFRSKIKV
jgi:hypothetical protein